MRTVRMLDSVKNTAMHLSGFPPGLISARASSQSAMRGAEVEVEVEVVAQVRPGEGNSVGVEDCGIAAASVGAAMHFFGPLVICRNVFKEHYKGCMRTLG